LVTSVSHNRLVIVFASLVAAAVPLIILGKVMVGVPAVLALLTIFVLPQRAKCWAIFRKTLTTNTAKLIYVTAAVWLVGLSVSSDVGKSLQTEIRLLATIAGTAAIWAALTVHRDVIGILMKALVISCTILGALAVISLIGPYEPVVVIRGYDKSGIWAARLLKAPASSAAMLIPMLVWVGFRLRGAWAALSALAIVELMAVILMTESRSALAGILATVMVVGIVIIISQRNAKIRLAWVAAMLGCLSATVVWLYFTRSWAVQFTDGADWRFPVWLVDAARQGIWSYAWDASEDSRWFGVGINVINKIAGAENLNTVTTVANIPLHPHNWMVEIIVETGVVGFVAMMATIAYRFLSFLRRFVHHREPALLALMAVWAAYWGSGLFNFSYWSSWWQVSFLLLTAVCLAGRENLVAKD
jgi:O-antigen ligase